MPTHSARNRELNDMFRTTFVGGKVVITAGVAALGADLIETALTKVRSFDDFNPENDPYGEHDFGSFDVKGEKFFWKMDYYNPAMDAGSEDPADPRQTQRLLTVMLANEY